MIKYLRRARIADLGLRIFGFAKFRHKRAAAFGDK
jgi:hypothetical protein